MTSTIFSTSSLAYINSNITKSDFLSIVGENQVKITKYSEKMSWTLMFQSTYHFHRNNFLLCKHNGIILSIEMTKHFTLQTL